jgi:hypothetical protein
MMIDHSDAEGGRCNYDMVVDRLTKKAILRRDRIDGRECIYIEAEEIHKLGHTTILKIWHDINHNYLIRRIENHDVSRPRDRIVMEIAEFSEPAKGVVVPLKCISTVYLADQIIQKEEMVLSDVQVNQFVPESTFVLPALPSQTKVQDSIQGTIGTIGPDWKTTGRSTSMPKFAIAPAKAEEFEGSPTVGEPWSIYQYLLCGSIILFVVCVAILVSSRRHTTETTSSA